MVVIDVISTSEINGEVIGYVCEPSPESAAAQHEQQTGVKPKVVYRRVHGKQKFTTFYILKRKGSKK